MKLTIIFNKPMEINGMADIKSYVIESYPPYLNLNIGESVKVVTSHMNKGYTLDDIKSIHVSINEE